jgi:predicted nucleic acid-binding protein
MDAALLDTDILSEILKAKNQRVLACARTYLLEHSHFAFSAITFYEVTRGFRATQAERQLAHFAKLAAGCETVPISTTILDRAATLWAEANIGGHPRDDADLIIASTALETSRVLVTGNTTHFAWIPGLSLEDWRKMS